MAAKDFFFSINPSLYLKNIFAFSLFKDKVLFSEEIGRGKCRFPFVVILNFGSLRRICHFVYCTENKIQFFVMKPCSFSVFELEASISEIALFIRIKSLFSLNKWYLHLKSRTEFKDN